jgi:hypothetical protein
MPANVQLDYACEYHEGDLVEHAGAVYRFRRDWTPRTFSSFDAEFIQGGVLSNATPRQIQEYIRQKLEGLIVARARAGDLAVIFRRYYGHGGSFINCARALKNLVKDHAIQSIPFIRWIECDTSNNPDIQTVDFRFEYRPAWVSGPITEVIRASYELLQHSPANPEAVLTVTSVAPLKSAPPKLETVLPWEEV